MSRPTALAAVATFVLMGCVVPLVEAGIYDQPDSKRGGGIVGTIAPADRVERVIVFEPDDEHLFLARFDRASGRFEVKGIPPGRYDVIVKFDSVVVDGLSLRTPGGTQKIDDDDLAMIRERVYVSEDYFNQKRIVRLMGNSRRAKAFVEQIRDKPTYNPDGTLIENKLIRRLDVLDLRKSGRVWVLKSARHQFREERSLGKPGEALTFRYAPGLSRVRVADEMVEVEPFDLAKDTGDAPEPSYTGYHREGADD